GRPPHKGAPRLGRGVGALVPAQRAGSHPPAGVCASVHRNAGGGGGPAGAGQPGLDGAGRRGARAGGKRPEDPAPKVWNPPSPLWSEEVYSTAPCYTSRARGPRCPPELCAPPLKCKEQTEPTPSVR
uniref:Uncharacterized protein n=1 Tax=Chlorocebus sabaeus TaxID=60711 RepID=A0A0D9RIR9_CHLSB